MQSGNNSRRPHLFDVIEGHGIAGTKPSPRFYHEGEIILSLGPKVESQFDAKASGQAMPSILAVSAGGRFRFAAHRAGGNVDGYNRPKETGAGKECERNEVYANR